LSTASLFGYESANWFDLEIKEAIVPAKVGLCMNIKYNTLSYNPCDCWFCYGTLCSFTSIAEQ
jgi:hypothetical protein